MKKLKVSVDDIEVSINEIFPFYQQDPFPGNHSYELQIIFDNEDQVRKVVNLYHLDKLYKVNWNMFFLYLSGIWPEIKRQNSTSYLLNSVEDINVTPNSINLKGICSTIILST